LLSSGCLQSEELALLAMAGLLASLRMVSGLLSIHCKAKGGWLVGVQIGLSRVFFLVTKNSVMWLFLAQIQTLNRIFPRTLI